MTIRPRIIAILDTDVFSYYAKGSLEFRIPRLELLGVSAMTVHEVSKGISKNPDLSRRLINKIETAFRRLNILEYDVSCAEIGGKIEAKLEQRGERLGLADIIIAATALSYEVPLLTMNQKHFERVDGLTFELQ